MPKKKRGLKVITRRLSAEVRSSGVSVELAVGNVRGEKNEEGKLGRSDPGWKLSWTDEPLKKSFLEDFQGPLPA